LPLLDLFINPKKKNILQAQEEAMKKMISTYFHHKMTEETNKKVNINVSASYQLN
jgi:DNA uptake protein ComE-like DNA-binding protein